MKRRQKRYSWSCFSCCNYGYFHSSFIPEGRNFQRQLRSIHDNVAPRCDWTKAKIQVFNVVQA